MAYVVGKKRIKDGSPFESFAYGVTFPIQRGNGGYFEQTFTAFEQAKANLLNLLQTQKGERVMQPQFGSGLHDLLFEQMDDEEFELALQETITQSVNYWLPYVNIEEIEVDISDQMKDRNMANLKIKFSIDNEITTDTITFTIGG